MSVSRSLMGLTFALASAAVSSPADAAITITINEVGTGVEVVASGTFDRSLATPFFNLSQFSRTLRADLAAANFGTVGSLNVYQMTGTQRWGSGATGPISSGSGFGTIFNVNSGAFGVATGYVSNTAYAATGTAANQTFASLGMNVGTYNYMAGGNAITVIIGNPAAAGVPEPMTWAMMVLGFGAIGYALRRRPALTARIRFA